MKDDLRVAITKKMLREGLLEILKNKDISKINVSELCMRAGVNRATFYRHYQQPLDIIVEVRYGMFNDIKHLVEKQGLNLDIKVWLEDMCKYFYDRKDLLNAVFRCRTDDGFVSFINEVCSEHFSDLRSRGYCVDLDDDEIKLTTYCFAGGVYYILRQWITEPIDKSPEQIAAIMLRFLSI